MRPYWKGYLKLALVSCPIALHCACSSAERIAFRQINKATLLACLCYLITTITKLAPQVASHWIESRIRSAAIQVRARGG
jgi:hypothetical protein